jgi:hypothetical protein
LPLHPKVPKDLALAPLAVGIDMNLQRLRDKTPGEVAFELALELDSDEREPMSEEERADRVLQVALRNVDMHHWSAAVTPDRARLRLSGGSVTLDLGLSASILAYITSAREADGGPVDRAD